jgi:DNA-binding CsgD family transcriptional regulator
MDQVVSDHSCCAREHLEQFVTALNNGIILVSSDGQIRWIDERTRRRVNGGLQNLVLPVAKSDAPALDCFISAVDVMINGERTPLCIVQETSEQSDVGIDFIAAIEAIMSDTSWFKRAFVDKLKVWRQGVPRSVRSTDLDLLTDREREILGLICEGRGDGEMSKMLNLSPNTVRNHVAALYRKIGVNRRSAAIIWARERAITSQEALAPKRRPRSRPNGTHQIMR